ncbi:hypothetical protein ACWFRJ_39330 [Streptomyces sp. NPDC055239]
MAEALPGLLVCLVGQGVEIPGVQDSDRNEAGSSAMPCRRRPCISRVAPERERWLAAQEECWRLAAALATHP